MVNGGDGMAIVDQGLSFGGGCLQQFGINSNTSANSFLKCLIKKKVQYFKIKHIGNSLTIRG